MKVANVQQCYDVNFLGISDTSITAYNDAAKCKEAAHSSIKNSFGFINSLTSVSFCYFCFCYRYNILLYPLNR